MTILGWVIFAVVAIFLFVFLIYVALLLKKIINQNKVICNELNSLRLTAKVYNSEPVNKGVLTNDEFGKLTSVKLTEVVVFISMAIIPICFAESIPNIIKNYPLSEDKEFLRNVAHILNDLIGCVIVLLLIMFGFDVLSKINNLIKDKSRKTLVKIQNFIFGFCISSLMFFNSFFLWNILRVDIAMRWPELKGWIIVMLVLGAIISLEFILLKDTENKPKV